MKKQRTIEADLATIEGWCREGKVGVNPGDAIGNLPAMQTGDKIPPYSLWWDDIPAAAEAGRLWVAIEKGNRPRIVFVDDVLIVDKKALLHMAVDEELRFPSVEGKNGTKVNGQDLLQLARDGRMRVMEDSRRIVLREKPAARMGARSMSLESQSTNCGCFLTWEEVTMFVVCAGDPTPMPPIPLCCPKNCDDWPPCEGEGAWPAFLKVTVSDLIVDDPGSGCTGCNSEESYPLGIEFEVPQIACDDVGPPKAVDYYLDDLGDTYSCMRDIGIAITCSGGNWLALVHDTFPSDGGPLTITSHVPFAASGRVNVNVGCNTSVLVTVTAP